jgi:hypothetical protein
MTAQREVQLSKRKLGSVRREVLASGLNRVIAISHREQDDSGAKRQSVAAFETMYYVVI